MNSQHPAPPPSFESYGGTAPENYERYFVPAIGAPLAEDLHEHAALHPGERVLDVACGTGVATRMAAERAGPTGSVAGLDLNPGMLAVARAVTPESMDIEWHAANAEDTGLPDGAFDVVLCQMGLQFCSNQAAALREMRRMLAPGGRLVMNLPGPTPELFVVFKEVLRQHAGPDVAKFVNAVFALHDKETIRGLLADAGFDDVVVSAAKKKLRLGAPADFLWRYVSSTPLAAPLAKLDRQRRSDLERDLVLKWQPFMQDGVLTMAVNVVTAVATKTDVDA